jgi:hypothetical protein
MKILFLTLLMMVCIQTANATDLLSDKPAGTDLLSSIPHGTDLLDPNGHGTDLLKHDPPPPKVDVLDPSFCDALIKHTPRADVAYQAGVDAQGKAVTSADLPGQPQMQIPSKINIPLTLNLAKTLNLNTNTYPYNQLGSGTEAQLGMLTVDGDQVLFNGKPISDTQQDNLAVLCMKKN